MLVNAHAVKNICIKVFNLMSRTNETRYLSWHETCTCICRLDASVCNDKQRWNNDKCRCEFKELIDKGRCDKGFIWNPSNWKCECDKSSGIGEYLDYANFQCRKRLIDKLVEECTEDINEDEIIHNVTLNNHRKVCNSCTLYILLLVNAFLVIIGIGSVYIYSHWYLKRNNTGVNTIVNTETKIY